MPRRKGDDGQLDLFGSRNSENDKQALTELDRAISVNMGVNDMGAAKEAARRQEELLKRIIADRKNKPA